MLKASQFKIHKNTTIELICFHAYQELAIFFLVIPPPFFLVEKIAYVWTELSTAMETEQCSTEDQCCLFPRSIFTEVYKELQWLLAKLVNWIFLQMIHFRIALSGHSKHRISCLSSQKAGLSLSYNIGRFQMLHLL